MSAPARISRLLDQLAPGGNGDPLVALLCTTFGLQPDWLETDYLPTVFGLGAWDDRSWSSRIAIERRLAELGAAVVFQSADQFAGRPRSLRISLEPVPTAGHQVLHAKVTLLVRESSVRLVVGSANLTEPGYRRNREIVAVLEASEKHPANARLILSGLHDLPRRLGDRWTIEADSIVKRASSMLGSWSLNGGESDSEWFAWGGGPEPLWRQFLSKWPANEPVEQITIVSPFWSRSTQGGPIDLLIRELRTRDSLAASASIRVITSGRRDSKGTLLPVLPEEYGTFDLTQLGVIATAQATDPQVSPDELDGVEDARPRDLHAKVVLLKGRRTSLAYLGSANFTRRGWGFIAQSASNIEAGLILLRTGKYRSALDDLIPPTAGTAVALNGAASARIVPLEPMAPEPPWPSFLHRVQLAPVSGRPGESELQVSIDEGTVRGPWALAAGKEGDSSPPVEILARDGPKQGEVGLHTASIPLTTELHTRLVYAKYVIVEWWGGLTPTFPINIHPDARDSLPLAPGGERPGERLLLQYYQSRIAFEDLFPPPAGCDDSDDPSAAQTPAEMMVDTSRIQSYQVREFVEALRGIRDDLKAAIATPATMRLAVTGAVSPVALGRHVADAVKHGQRSPTAGAFQLVEILSCLAEVRSAPVREDHSSSWLAVLTEAETIIGDLLTDIRARAPADFGRPFARYERAARALHKPVPSRGGGA